MDNTIHAFNTGRWYSEAGQRIAYVQLDDNSIYFYDIDRGIDQLLPPMLANDCEPSDAYVLNEYDHGRYAFPGIEVRDLWEAKLIAAAKAVPPAR